MKAYGFAIWLNAMSEGGSSAGTGEFSDSEIAAWEVSARRARARKWLVGAMAWCLGRLALAARRVHPKSAQMAAR